MASVKHKTITVPPSPKFSQIPPRVDRLETVKDGANKYESLLQYFETIGPLPVSEESKETRELDDDEKQYLVSDYCCSVSRSNQL